MKTLDHVINYLRERSHHHAPGVTKYLTELADCVAEAKAELKKTAPAAGWGDYNGEMGWFASDGTKCRNPFVPPRDQKSVDAMQEAAMGCNRFENAGNPLAVEVLVHYSANQATDFPRLPFAACRAAADFLTREGLLKRVESSEHKFVGPRWKITPKGFQHVKQLADIPFPRPDPVSPAFGWRKDVSYADGFVPRHGPNLSDAELEESKKWENNPEEDIIFNGIHYRRHRP